MRTTVDQARTQAIRWAAIVVISVIVTAAMAITKTEAPAPDHTWSQPANFFASPYRAALSRRCIRRAPVMRENEGFDILHNGVPRTFRDRKNMAYEAARFAKSQNPAARSISP